MVSKAKWELLELSLISVSHSWRDCRVCSTCRTQKRQEWASLATSCLHLLGLSCCSCCSRCDFSLCPGADHHPYWWAVDLELFFSSRLRLSQLSAGKVSRTAHWLTSGLHVLQCCTLACKTDGHHPECLQGMLTGCAEHEVAAILGLT